MKECTVCHEVKQKGEFSQHRRLCKDCRRAQIRRYRETHVEETKARCRAHHAKNRSKMRAYAIVYYRKNRAVLTEKAKQRTARDPDLSRNASQKKLARIHGVQCDLTTDDWRAIVIEHDNRCIYCDDGEAKLTMDHKIPFSRGGGHTKANVVPACLSCNSSKRSLTYDEFVARLRGGYYGRAAA